VLRYCGGHQIIGLPRQNHAFFRFKVMQCWRSDRQDLYIHPAFIHQRYPALPKIVEPFLDLAAIEPCGTFLPNRGGRPCGPNPDS
jgi:hypothetical protein